MIFRFNLRYFLVAFALFLVEVLIATVFKNFFILRAFGGDVIVVVLIYFFLISFFKFKNQPLLIFGIFLFSILVEVLQYIGIAEMMKLEPGSAAHIVVGSSFSWWDIFSYFLGCVFLWIFHKKWTEPSSNP